MHYTEIEMAESVSTPTKIFERNPLSRLCGGSHEGRYMLRIFSKAGSTKDLCSKVYKTCGIKISEDDTNSGRSTVLCRNCVKFVDKMDQFIRRAQSLDNTPSDLNSEYSVKRCVQLSPSSHQPSNRITSGRSAKQLPFSAPPATTAAGDNSKCTTTSAKQPKRTTSHSAEEVSLSTPQDATFVLPTACDKIRWNSTRLCRSDAFAAPSSLTMLF